MELKTLRDIEAKLAEYIPAVKEITGKDITLQRMEPLMKALGNPEKKLKIIHIAGTSGKTSTTYYVTSLLMQAGKKVGTTVSPHVDSVTERVQVNLVPIGEKDFAEYLTTFLDIMNGIDLQPTYFEVLVAFVYWYFEKIGVDYAVIETGMGGLHDGTNVASSADKVCVITDIGFDHMHVLGSTLPEIAKHKAGIIHKDNYVVMFEQATEITDVFKDWSKNIGATLHVFTPPSTIGLLATLPEFQQRNWQLAYEAYKYIQERDGLQELSQAQLDESMHVQVPGRMDEVMIGNMKIIMDGAHNVQKMSAFVSSFQKQYSKQKAAVLLSLKQDKKFADVLPVLLPITDTLILTTFTGRQDLPAEGIEPDDLRQEAEAAGFTNIITEPDSEAAFQKLLKSGKELSIITGSFYLLGQLRREHTELKHA